MASCGAVLDHVVGVAVVHQGDGLTGFERVEGVALGGFVLTSRAAFFGLGILKARPPRRSSDARIKQFLAAQGKDSGKQENRCSDALSHGEAECGERLRDRQVATSASPSRHLPDIADFPTDALSLFSAEVIEHRCWPVGRSVPLACAV
jgi:hypothetical protein